MCTPVGAGLTVILFALGGCADGLDPLSTVPAPAGFKVEAVRLGAVNLTWDRVDPDVVGYAIERRANLAGDFVPLGDQVPQTGLAQAVYLDTDIEPDTYYGYRVYAITKFGDRSPPSVVGGVKSPPLPGIEVTTASLFPSPESVDPDGYELVIIGPDTVRQTVGTSATRRFSPLRPGQYQVTLGGVINRCEIDGAAVRTVIVTESTPETVVPVTFNVTCRDPSRGEITVTVSSSGTAVDGEHPIELLGEASDPTLPDSARIISRTQSIGAASGSTRFINLRPGTYNVTLEDLATNCQVDGPRTRTVTVAALDVDEIRFNVSCTSGNGGGNPDPGYQYRATWTSLSGNEYALDLRIDMTTLNRPDITDVTTSGVTGDPLTGAQVTVAYDASRLVYDRLETVSAPNITTQSVNGSTPGSVAVISAVTGLGPTGNVGFARLIFRRVAGSPAGTVVTATTLQAVSSRTGTTTVNITADVRINEATLTIGTGGGGTNQPPTAEANGPYTGTAGVALSLSSTGSTDSDGTIASYSWALGNGQTATGASPSVTYAAAGTYTAVLTVTDNDGATDTDQATITVAGSGNPDTGYQYRATWTSLGGNEYALDLRIDMSTFNRPDISNVITSGVTGDPLTGAQVTVAYDASRLAYDRFGTVSAPSITTQSVNGSTPGSVAVISAITGVGPTGNVGFARLIFRRVAGSPAGTVVTTTTLQGASSRTGTSTVNITANVRKNEGTLTIDDGGGGTNQPPVAEANGPYTATAGVAITLSSAGSVDPDGSIASYSWALGNGQTATGASPSVTYAAAGTYTIVLTVADNRGGIDTDQATVTVSAPAATQPLIWKNVVGPIDVANDIVAITVTYDLRTNLPETPGVEVLSTFKVDSLKWDPSVLQFFAINLGPNVTGSSNQSKVSAGNLAFQGSVAGAQAQGLINIATVRFKLVGTAGSRTTTVTFLGTLQGAPATGNYVYNGKTSVVEGEVVTP